MTANRGRARLPIRVVIADDHAVVREGIRHVLSSDSAFEVVGEAADGEEAVALAQTLRPDVVVLDLTMPRISGFDAAVRIRETLPDTGILVLTIHEHEEYVQQSMRAGAQGYLCKDCSPAELRGAVRALHEGRTYFSAPAEPHLPAALNDERPEQQTRARMAMLTVRERDVLVQIAHGATNKEIAARFGISVRTVESHREMVMKKLGVRGVASLTRVVLDAGLLAKREAP